MTTVIRIMYFVPKHQHHQPHPMLGDYQLANIATTDRNTSSHTAPPNSQPDAYVFTIITIF